MKTTCQSCGATVAIPDSMTVTQAARVLARRASAAPSLARQAASRANGRKGGRPRRRPTTGAPLPVPNATGERPETRSEDT